MNSTNATTTSAVAPYTFENKPVSIVVDEQGQPWFNAIEVCNALGFGNHRQAIDSHVDGDDVQKLDAIDSLGRKQPTNHINESGLYALIFGSTKPEAKRFKRWVTSEVLPAIRKTGQYQHQAAQTPPASITQRSDSSDPTIADDLAQFMIRDILNNSPKEVHAEIEGMKGFLAHNISEISDTVRQFVLAKKRMERLAGTISLQTGDEAASPLTETDPPLLTKTDPPSFLLVN